MFRGREIVHPELGHEMMKRIIESLGTDAIIESGPRMEGRSMMMIVAPSKTIAKKKTEG
jgi:translation initiation factor IF-3